MSTSDIYIYACIKCKHVMCTLQDPDLGVPVLPKKGLIEPKPHKTKASNDYVTVLIPTSQWNYHIVNRLANLCYVQD